MRLVDLIVSLLIMGIVGFLCSFFMVANMFKDDIWDILKEKEEDDDTRN